jgi:Tfp pilus assembly protein PilV
MTHMRARIQRSREKGMTIVELMIAMVILITGMASLLGLIIVAIGNNNKAKVDTGATLVSQLVIETLAAQTNPTVTTTIKDCSNVDAVVSGAPGNGALLDATTGAIDFTGQTYAAAPTNYKMKYKSCGSGVAATTYDVRWNVATLTAFSRQITVSARPVGMTNAGSGTKTRLFIAPVTLRTIALTN